MIVNVISKQIKDWYSHDRSIRGSKGDRFLKFFDVVDEEPKDWRELAAEYFLEDLTIKNHRRFDPYPERGVTKTKNGRFLVRLLSPQNW